RGTTALHSIIHGTFGRATEHMLAVRMAAREGLPLNEAIDKANQMLYDPGGIRHALEQQVANEGLTGVRAQMRLDQLLGEQLPKQLLSESDYWGTEANNLQKPYGLLGIVEGGLSDTARKNPWLRQFFPFLRIPANLLNMSLDMSPLGFQRYFQHEGYLLAGGREISTKEGEQYITQERYDEVRGA